MITQRTLQRWAGSEVVTVEVAEALQNMDLEVCVYSFAISDELREYLEKQNIRAVTNPNDSFFDTMPDLIWCHHQVLPEKLANTDLNTSKSKFIFNHMSPYEPLEQPFLFEFENEMADCIIYNSDETLGAITESFFAPHDKRLRIFQNPAPQKFHSRINIKKSTNLKKVLRVSNHACPELDEALNYLSANSGIEIRQIGNIKSQKKIEPEDIDWADTVITIGKTVQYAICRHRPVYVYDIWGGPGYLRYDNFVAAEKLNFSGRCTLTKKTARQIREELISGFERAVLDSKSFYEKCEYRFSLEKNIKEILALPGERQTKASNVQIWRSVSIIQKLLRRDVIEIDSVKKEIDEIKKEKLFWPLRKWLNIKFRILQIRKQWQPRLGGGQPQHFTS